MALTKAHNRMIDGAAVTPEDFGAAGNGVTNDTAALQAAFNYAIANDKAIVTNGVYNHAGAALSITGSLNWSGYGRIEIPAGGNNIVIDGDGGDVKISGVTIKGAGQSSTALADSVETLYFSNANLVRLENVEITDLNSDRTVKAERDVQRFEMLNGGIKRVGPSNAIQSRAVDTLVDGVTFDDLVSHGVRGGVDFTDQLSITAITKANPAVVTAAGHDYQEGDWVYINYCSGMTELNAINFFKVGTVSGDTFQLDGIDSTGFGTYTGNGKVVWTTSSLTVANCLGILIGQSAGTFVLVEVGCRNVVIDGNNIRQARQLCKVAEAETVSIFGNNADDLVGGQSAAQWLIQVTDSNDTGTQDPAHVRIIGNYGRGMRNGILTNRKSIVQGNHLTDVGRDAATGDAFYGIRSEGGSVISGNIIDGISSDVVSGSATRAALFIEGSERSNIANNIVYAWTGKGAACEGIRASGPVSMITNTFVAELAANILSGAAGSLILYNDFSGSATPAPTGSGVAGSTLVGNLT